MQNLVPFVYNEVENIFTILTDIAFLQLILTGFRL